jgi:hypothetical protein
MTTDDHSASRIALTMSLRWPALRLFLWSNEFHANLIPGAPHHGRRAHFALGIFGQSEGVRERVAIDGRDPGAILRDVYDHTINNRSHPAGVSPSPKAYPLASFEASAVPPGLFKAVGHTRSVCRHKNEDLIVA